MYFTNSLIPLQIYKLFFIEYNEYCNNNTSLNLYDIVKNVIK